MKHKLSLQTKITLQTCILLLIVGVSIVIFSMSRANTLLINSEPSLFDESTLMPPASNENSMEVAEILQPPVKDTFDRQVLLFTFSAISIGTVVIYFTSKKALKPLNDVTSYIENIDSNHLDKRLPTSYDSYEASLIAEAFNDLLERIEDSFELQKSFSSNVAHELKTPLSIMKTSIQTLDSDSLALEDYKKHNVHQLEAVDKLTTTVDDLLLIAKGATLSDFPKEDIDLSILIDTIVETCESHYKHKEIIVESSYQDLYINASLSLTYRVLYNIIDNAYKYSIPNSTLIIEGYRESKGVSISVTNTSSSLKKEDINTVFNPLFRSPDAKNSTISGSGLGLAVVKSIMESQGSTISLSLEQNTVTVDLKFKV